MDFDLNLKTPKSSQSTRLFIKKAIKLFLFILKIKRRYLRSGYSLMASYFLKNDYRNGQDLEFANGRIHNKSKYLQDIEMERLKT